ncbi:hypothetical protein HY624_02685 [Candidatus Uhrbacteria bacterium]|nr:hypothetical protein [Candidatus Uhrbacteria bacterium]
MGVNIDRAEWKPDALQLDAFGALVEMIVNVLTVQDDLRREKKGEPVTGLLEQRMPEKLIATLKEECDEMLEGIQKRDRVNQYEEASDLLMRFARICRTLELDPTIIVRVFFVKARAIAEHDAAGAQERDKDAERAAMERLIAEYEGE